MSQRCTLEATESNGHHSATMTVVLSACIGPLVTVSVCTVSKICQLFLKKKKKRRWTHGRCFFSGFVAMRSTKWRTHSTLQPAVQSQTSRCIYQKEQRRREVFFFPN